MAVKVGTLPDGRLLCRSSRTLQACQNVQSEYKRLHHSDLLHLCVYVYAEVP
jgi:hypothetical protein